MTNYKKPTLDKDLDKLGYMEEAAGSIGRRLVAPGIALLFITLSAVIAGATGSGHPGLFVVIAAAAIGAYMALNIGANDVANNVGPAVGSRAMTMTTALIIAAVFESAGALVAGGDVVGTISKGIVDPASVASPGIFTAAMMAALMSSALWINLATWIGAPVSTTHSIVGGVMGAGIAAAGFAAVQWGTVGSIAASWVISPLFGGVIAAAFLAFIKNFIVYQDDKLAAARRWVPVLIAVMAGAFTAYLAMKGLSKVIKIGLGEACGAGLAVGLLSWIICRPLVARQSRGLENRNQSLRKLFALPLICSAALLSFAHGANDVANAVGPLAAIVHTAELGDVAEKVTIPLWVMAVGALGISFGLVLFGPRLIDMVGAQITKLNPMRAFCVALSAAITVIIASALGLPVSSTHIAVGAVFGVGFYREWYTENSARRMAYMERKHDDKIKKVRPLKNREEQTRRKLVRRAHFMTIVAAWVVTVPVAAILSGVLYFLLVPFLAG
ncbi:inorganic phosphate transporter [Roseibium litorale]|uniref:Phosphate transporter n=1 Tax=Roseibium litorale TaxID=2803841 RepID=A0ABR9CGE8_9HYPH|nr:inorganic phosphate transporter [Roseibium litorale]MBD8889987.1 inorganic phosphate transporter [Roseibium litorale]